MPRKNQEHRVNTRRKVALDALVKRYPALKTEGKIFMPKLKAGQTNGMTDEEVKKLVSSKVARLREEYENLSSRVRD